MVQPAACVHNPCERGSVGAGARRAFRRRVSDSTFEDSSMTSSKRLAQFAYTAGVTLAVLLVTSPGYLIGQGLRSIGGGSQPTTRPGMPRPNFFKKPNIVPGN